MQSFIVGNIAQNITDITVQGFADVVQCGKADGLRLAAFQDRHICHRDAYLIAQLGQRHFPLGQHDVKCYIDHSASPQIVRSFSSRIVTAQARRREIQ